MRGRYVLVGMLLVVLAVAGCAADGDVDGNGGLDETDEETATDESPEFEMVAPPGLYDLPDGTTQALGILTYRDAEGGFWAVASTAVPEEAASADVVAVVLPGEGVDVDLQTMNGQYVSVVGRRADGASVYQAGPVIDAESVQVVRETVVE